MLNRRQFHGLMVLLAGATFAAGIGTVAPAQAAEPVTVFAAASLKNALDALNSDFKATSGTDVQASYAASSALAKQIETGAPADVFISADLQWMDYLADKKMIKGETRLNLLGNALVLIAPKDKAVAVTLNKDLDLTSLLAGGKLAMGAVDSVPAGKYGKQALESLGLWSKVEGQVAGAENVRAALLLVSRGEAPLGIVYKTDAVADPGVAIVGTFPDDSHKPIFYPVGITSDSKSGNAKAYLDFLKSDKAKADFEAQGFIVLPQK